MPRIATTTAATAITVRVSERCDPILVRVVRRSRCAGRRTIRFTSMSQRGGPSPNTTCVSNSPSTVNSAASTTYDESADDRAARERRTSRRVGQAVRSARPPGSGSKQRDAAKSNACGVDDGSTRSVPATADGPIAMKHGFTLRAFGKHCVNGAAGGCARDVDECCAGHASVSCAFRRLIPLRHAQRPHWFVVRSTPRARTARALRRITWASTRSSARVATGLLLTTAVVLVVAGGAAVGVLFWMVRRDAGLAAFDLRIARWGASNATRLLDGRAQAASRSSEARWSCV